MSNFRLNIFKHGFVGHRRAQAAPKVRNTSSDTRIWFLALKNRPTTVEVGRVLLVHQRCAWKIRSMLGDNRTDFVLGSWHREHNVLRSFLNSLNHCADRQTLADSAWNTLPQSWGFSRLNEKQYARVASGLRCLSRIGKTETMHQLQHKHCHWGERHARSHRKTMNDLRNIGVLGNALLKLFSIALTSCAYAGISICSKTSS